jgi:cell division protein FtsB
MLPFQERKKFRKILYSKITIVVLGVLLLLVGRGAWNIHERAVIARAERAQMGRTVDELDSRAIELEKSLTSLRGSRGVEEEVRRRYMVARPEEDVVVIVDDDRKKSENDEAVKGGTLWSRIWGMF